MANELRNSPSGPEVDEGILDVVSPTFTVTELGGIATIGSPMIGDLNANNFSLLDLKNLTFDSVLPVASSATPTINWNAAQAQQITLNANATFTFTAPAGPARLMLVITQDATGGRTGTFPANVLAPGGKAVGLTLSTAGNSVDVIAFLYTGTSYLAVISKNFLV
jgi:hypothetical protein